MKAELKKLQEQVTGLMLTHLYVRPKDAEISMKWNMDQYTSEYCKTLNVKGRGLILNVAKDVIDEVGLDIKQGDFVMWEEKSWKVVGIERGPRHVGYVLRPYEQGKEKV
jgi:hypothetical protein